MFKILFLILVVMSSAVFAQESENKENPKAYIFAELGVANDAEIKAKMEEFVEELLNADPSTGYIINYGNTEKISTRESQIRNGFSRRCHHSCRIVIVNGGEREELKTVFWIVPYGAEPSTP